ncbi:hypothetical protein [Kitasatospora sp. NPDC057541]|uniref:hypothetical protein n=1 Tax=unclassified Kitasatospora TaxID=2633591 RepID=UPI0036922C68
MNTTLRERLPAEGRTEVDRLLTGGHNRVLAIVAIRECADAPAPGIHACMDLLTWRLDALGLLPAPEPREVHR